MSTVRYFRHDDAGAPVLTGEVGSLNNVLRKCLVGTAGEAYPGKPSAGWTEAFVGTQANVAAFRNKQADGASGAYFKVVDNGSGTGGAREASIEAFAVMTDIATGETPSGAVYIRKSATLSNVARKWLVAADGITAWVYTWDTGDLAQYGRDCSLAGLGDYGCVVGTGVYRYNVMGRSTQNNANGGDQTHFSYSKQSSAGGHAGFKIAPLSGIGSAGSAKIGFAPFPWTTNYAVGGLSYPAGPSGLTGEYFLQDHPPVYLEQDAVGQLRGLLLPTMAMYSLPHGALLPGSDRFVVVRGSTVATATDNTQFAVALDVVGPW